MRDLDRFRFLSFSCPFLTSPFLPFPSVFSPSLLLEVGSKNPASSLSERYEHPQRGLGRSPSRNRIGCILALKMRSVVNDFNHFKLTKLTNFVQFKRVFMFCLDDWGAWAPWPPLGYATGKALIMYISASVYKVFFAQTCIYNCTTLC